MVWRIIWKHKSVISPPNTKAVNFCILGLFSLQRTAQLTKSLHPWLYIYKLYNFKNIEQNVLFCLSIYSRPFDWKYWSQYLLHGCCQGKWKKLLFHKLVIGRDIHWQTTRTITLLWNNNIIKHQRYVLKKMLLGQLCTYRPLNGKTENLNFFALTF